MCVARWLPLHMLNSAPFVCPKDGISIVDRS